MLSKPRIVCAANLYDDGTLIVGARHFDSTMRRIIESINPDWHHWRSIGHEQGFIDQHGKFYSREDAWEIAFDNGQIIRDCGCDGTLFSENLY